jgi:hypothetical protein
METMVADTDVVAECAAIHEGMMHTETDGLPNA